MQPDANPSSVLCQRFHTLVWSCLDFDLYKSAVFYSERYFTLDPKSHDARHLYATALLRAGQTYSAMYLVDLPLEARCSGCLEIKSKCCSALGRHRQAQEALEESMQDASYAPTCMFLFFKSCFAPACWLKSFVPQLLWVLETLKHFPTKQLCAVDRERRH